MKWFPFFAIPRELRDQIYQEVLDQRVEAAFSTETKQYGEYIRETRREPDRIRTPGYYRPFVHYATFTEVQKLSKLPRRHGFALLEKQDQIAAADMTGFRSLLLVSKQMRMEALYAFGRQEIALEAVSLKSWSIALNFFSEKSGLPRTILANIRSLNLFLDVKATVRELDTRSRPILRIELTEDGQRLAVKSSARLKAEHDALLKSAVRKSVCKTSDAGTHGFTSPDLVRAIQGIFMAKVQNHEAGGVYAMSYGRRNFPAFEIEPEEGDVEAVSGVNRKYGEWMLSGRFKHEIVVIDAKDLMHTGAR